MIAETELRYTSLVRKYIPEAGPKETKNLVAMCDELESIGRNPKNALEVIRRVSECWLEFEERSPGISKAQRGHVRGAIRSSVAREKKRKAKAAQQMCNGQISLFHPEAFQGGDNVTLRDMPNG